MSLARRHWEAIQCSPEGATAQKLRNALHSLTPSSVGLNDALDMSTWVSGGLVGDMGRICSR